jgi:hypothetical protein
VQSDLRNRLSAENVENELFIKFNNKTASIEEKEALYYDIPWEDESNKMDVEEN